MNCPSCNQEVTPVRVGTGFFCDNCHARLDDSTTRRAKSPTEPRPLDLRPRAATSAGTAPQPARSLHQSPAPASRNVLDLREATPTKKPTRTPAARWNTKSTPEATPRITRNHPAPAPAPKTTAKDVHFGRFEDRFKQAKTVPRSQHITKFHGQFAPVAAPPEPTSTPTPAHHTPVTIELPRAVATQHQAMSRLAEPHLKPTTSRTAHYAAVAAVIAIMGGYIWLQNAPKLAIQSAGNRAGLSASLPGYVPSSYRLATTDTHPGLVTLKFTSPSTPDPLTIKQHRTTWDSRSLLDQFIIPKSSEYTTVEGQGLTVYLYGQNQATWVNHGIWYSIEGVSRLSREQILKIAYSL